MAVVGEIEIKTKIDNSEVDKGIQEIENKSENLKELDKQIAEAKKKTAEEQQKIKELQEQTAKSQEQILEYEKEIAELQQNEGLSEELQSLVDKYGVLMGRYMSLTDKSKGALIFQDDIKEAEILKKEIREVVDEIEKITCKDIKIYGIDIASEEAKNLQQQIDNIGKKLKNTTKSVIKWGLAFLGLSGILSFIKGSISTISQQDKELSADIQYMKNALAYSIEPIVRGIVNLMKQLLIYVQYIIYAWTGKNIFENANKSLASANKQAKTLKKQLAGFDEMNILSDNTGGDSGGATTPPFDLSQINDNVPDWIKWIADNGDIVTGIIAGLTGALISLKKLGLDPITSLGIGIAIAGIVYSIEKIIDFINDPSFENFIGILEGISVAIIGIGIAIGIATGFWPVAIAGAIALIVLEITKHFDQIKKWFDDLIKWIDTNVRKKLVDIFGPLFGNVLTEIILFFVNVAKGLFEGFYGGIKKIIDGIVKIFKGDLKGGIISVLDGIKDFAFRFINALISGLNSLIKGINKLSFDVPDWVPVIGGKKWGFNIPKIPKLAKGTIVSSPGKGVPTPYTNARYGEAGREAYLPLSDTQLLEELGSTIGKYININATVPVYVGNRQIAREIRKINAEDDFAYNGG